MTDPPRTLERHELPAEIERHAQSQARIARDLAKPDTRPVCPVHGPKNTLDGRFVCCGRVHEVVAVKEPTW